MRKTIKLMLVMIITIITISCNNISDKPVTEKLGTDELSKAIKADTSFASFYENVRKAVDDMGEVEKAKFNDVTYRRLFKYVSLVKDTNYWKPLRGEWEKEWELKYGLYSIKADSTLGYWKKFLEENSLNKYVKVELARIDKEYYEYIGGLKDVSLGFKLTPLQGSIEQIRFNYGYKAKINGDKYFEKHNCISTSPFSSPTVRYWEVGYSDKDNFSGKTVETFLRDYNLQIEVTHIRRNGINISTDDFNVPEEVSDYYTYADEDFMKDYYKEKLIKSVIFKDYLSKWEHTAQEGKKVLEREDKLCYDFLASIK